MENKNTLRVSDLKYRITLVVINRKKTIKRKTVLWSTSDVKRVSLNGSKITIKLRTEGEVTFRHKLKLMYKKVIHINNMKWEQKRIIWKRDFIVL